MDISLARLSQVEEHHLLLESAEDHLQAEHGLQQLQLTNVGSALTNALANQ
jgi:hypothetical protein